MVTEDKDKKDFGTWFAYDGFSALIKCVLFRSSAHYLLKKDEILLAIISSYYSLFHCGLSLVFFNPEKLDKSHDFLVELLKDRENGDDPQKKITHKKLISLLSKNKFTALPSKLLYGKQIREFYNYGPRVTLDKNGNPYFGNPISEQGKDKHSPKDGEEFVKSIDKVIFDEFTFYLKNTAETQLYVLRGLWNQTETYLNEETFHFKNLYSDETLASAKKFLYSLESLLNNILKNSER